MRCAECSTSNPLDHKHCKECGARLDDGYRTLLREARAAETPAEDAKAERLTQLLDMAFWHNEAGHLDAAIKACEAALSLHESNTTAHSLLGTLYEKKGDDATAIRHFQTVVTLNPDSAADAQKLDQLTRGVHVKAAAPPPVTRWIPPALASIRLTSPAAGGEDKDGARSRPRWVRLVGAACAFALVLGVGLSAMHSQSSPALNAGADRQANIVAPTSAPFVTERLAANTPPVTMQPGTTHGTGLSDIIPPPPYGPAQPKTAADPFAGHIPASAFTGSATSRSVRVVKAPRVPSGSRVASLPPLSLHAVPLPSEGVAPAPVDIPADARPAVPQHTVVVSSLTGQSQAGLTQASNTPALSPHIKITVNSADANDGPIVLSNVPGQSGDTAQRSADPDAARLQQSALSAQQNGNYKQARSWYEQAIRAYRAQIAAGRDVDTARRGLEACQTGLSICQQNPL